ncbi:SCP2 sterol-binding domain-containing protein [Sulfobacillus harzensis]|uniref:SCP2 sterol-binding domain-containing protein n=1 Tax=Sulfobacillus harzensis TaxID=2729629 RepID=UPI001A9BB040|nr:Fis family transcriptional regulator [Sulfobacillus harzensis]
MGYEVFTLEWAKAWKDELNRTDKYKKAGRTWEWPMVLLMEPDARVGIDTERAVYVDLFHGECREARPATAEDLAAVPYIVKADAETWRDLRDGRIEAIGAILRGRMQLEKGSMLVLARYVAAATELTRAVSRIQTVFPDETGTERPVEM